MSDLSVAKERLCPRRREECGQFDGVRIEVAQALVCTAVGAIAVDKSTVGRDEFASELELTRVEADPARP
ncbi:hypothetical protein GCM10007269_33800 [Microbacterium murale]|uniref:Uncharacterized protein n=1 Tax=Microbacterium murale TaxID=1081040 RepID=A0ABQ1S3G2_9MICO|nr:hypothetical protein GCM10007269_33800 [Microbacterium murale]